MTLQITAAIVLAAGKGTRMKSVLPKVMHPVAGRPMVNHVLDSLESAGITRTVVITGPDMPMLDAAVAPRPTALQTERLGTGHAALMAKPALADFEGDVLICFADSPLTKPETYARMIDARQSAKDPAVVVLGFRPENPAAYGRLILDDAGDLEAIVEFKDATEDQRQVSLCNSGVMCVSGKHLFALLEAIGNANAAGEYYLTDIVGLARNQGLGCVVVEGSEEEMLGVNSRVELSKAESIVQDRLREKAMLGGATLVDPASVTLSFDTTLGQDVLVDPHVVFGPGVTVGNNVHIKAFSHLEGATIAEGAIVGPYARLRPGADLAENAKIGNFVEIKQARIDAGAKVNHLSYVGDAHVGKDANIGAGTITCNYDGFLKSKTDIGAGAFIGSNSALVAPVTIGDGAIVGAGSTITKDVPGDAIAVTRARQNAFEGRAKAFRVQKQAAKDKRKGQE